MEKLDKITKDKGNNYIFSGNGIKVEGDVIIKAPEIIIEK